jgi:hypothetical protein
LTRGTGTPRCALRTEQHCTAAAVTAAVLQHWAATPADNSFATPLFSQLFRPATTEEQHVLQNRLILFKCMHEVHTEQPALVAEQPALKA